MFPVVGGACSYACAFCGAYRLQTDPTQSISFQRDGKFEWVTLSANASGYWYADGDNITVSINWGTFTGRMEGGKFIDSGGSVWVQTVEYRPPLLSINLPRPVVTPPPATTPMPAAMLTPIDYFKLGDWATASPWLMIVSSAEKTTQYYPFALLNAPPHTVLILVNVTVTNVGNSTQAIDANLFKIMDRSGNSYPPLQFTTVVSNQFPWRTKASAPGETASGNILYVVPNIASELSIVTLVNGKFLAWVLPW
jgi:hypothetical protein